MPGEINNRQCDQNRPPVVAESAQPLARVKLQPGKGLGAGRRPFSGGVCVTLRSGKTEEQAAFGVQIGDRHDLKNSCAALVSGDELNSVRFQRFR